MKNIILSFIENNIEYMVYKKDSSYIACKKVNDKVTLELTNEEKVLVNTMFNKLKVKNHLKLSNVVFEGVEYQHFYDKENDFHTFLHVDGTRLELEEFEKLNLKYNHQSEILYLGNSNKEDKLVHRLVKCGKKTILALMLASSLIPSTANLKAYAKETNKLEVVSEIEDYEIEEETSLSKEEKIANIKEAIMTNPNLTDNEKNKILKGLSVIDDNIDYMDYDLIVERMNSLKIVYHEGYESEDSQNIAGTYMPYGNVINFYYAASLDEVNISVFYHELYHAFQGEGYSNVGLTEQLNVTLNSEYAGEDNFFEDTGYDTRYVKAMMEIIGNEPFREYNYKPFINVIKDEFMKIIPDEAKFYSLMTSLASSTNVRNYENKSLERNTVEDLLGEYYEAKYNKPIYTNPYLLMLIYSYHVVLGSNNQAEDGYELYSSHANYDSGQSKDYFNTTSDSYLKTPGVTVHLNWQKQDEIICSKEEAANILKEQYSMSVKDAIKYGVIEEVDANNYKIVNYQIKAERINVTEDYLMDNKELIEKQIEDLHERRKEEYNNYLIQKRLDEIKKEIEDVVDNMKVNKLAEDEKIVYQNKKGDLKVNIDSKYVKKLNKRLSKQNLFQYSYSIIPELNVLSIKVTFQNNEMKVYNINLTNGKSYNVKNKLKKYGYDDMVLDADYIYLEKYGDKTNIITYTKMTIPETDLIDYRVQSKGELQNKNKYIKDGKIKLKDDYINEISNIIKNTFPEGYNYNVQVSGNTASYIFYNNNDVLVYTVDATTGEKVDLSNKYEMNEGVDTSKLLISDNGSIVEVQIIDGNLEFIPAVGRITKGK